MPLQDLTPQLRTRLSRVERAVGLFIAVATLLLVAGFAYYVYHTAERKGWFLTKVTYYTYVEDAAGLKAGAPVKLMGFDVGEITFITAMAPDDEHNVYIEFQIQSPYYGYLWSDSKVRVAAADFLGNRFMEVLKGVNGKPTVREDKKTVLILTDPAKNLYEPVAGGKKPRLYGLECEESPALTRRLEVVVNKVEQGLPGFLALTNKIADVLATSTGMIAHVDTTVVNANTVMTNLAVITANLRDPRGSLGDWIIPTNIHRQIQTTMDSANNTFTTASATLTTANTNIATVATLLKRSLEDSAAITSNLNAQVQANSTILSELSGLIIHADEVMQGLKRHWLLKDSFTGQTNQPIKSIVVPRVGGGK
ncbi:MAG: MCE family protein [Verrucomicrobia bacterium]|nr:MCE family protein [Verrucomicrobiota bacterium]